jgi:xanthine dehydrogenase small subunit
VPEAQNQRQDADAVQQRGVRFVLDGRVVELHDIDPTRSVLSVLRDELRRPGTKEGCAEGDCGACTVVIGDLRDGRMRLQAVNSCICFAPTLDGKALFTVESLAILAGTGAALHPVQQAMVDCHGSQCGFCTPGFVMSLWALYMEHAPRGTRPGGHEVRTALAGNLCRCTGYRPILEAAGRMFELPTVGLDTAALQARLDEILAPAGLAHRSAAGRFFAPRSLAELTALRTRHPDATILAGGTDVGLWVTKQLRELPTVIYVGHVAELLRLDECDGRLRIGAAVSLTDAARALIRHYPASAELWERFASVPIRNAGTLGGNVANGSPIGDSMPVLIALGAEVVLASTTGERRLALEDLYLGYQKKAMRADEIVASVEVPLPDAALRFRTYKNSKRYDSDISAVCFAAALRVDGGGGIASVRIAYGGMAAIPKRARAVESALLGKPWSEQAVRAAMGALDGEFAPLSDMRATAGYRMNVARNLLYRFFLETRPDAPLAAHELSVFAAAERI